MAAAELPRKVLAFGTFDVLHAGHLYYLTEAKKKGDALTVIVARDRTVARIKGMQPMNNENDRLGLVQALKIVDKARLGNLTENLLKAVEEEQPDVLALGYDQQADEKELAAQLGTLGLQPEIIRIASFRSDRYKSSKLKNLLSGQ